MGSVILLVIGEILCYAGKDFFHKKYSTSYSASALVIAPVFNILMGIVTAIGTWIFAGFRYHPDVPTFVIGAFGGIALFAYYYSATNAAQKGSYSLQSLTSQLGNIIIPLLVAVLIWSDSPSLPQFVGILLMLSAFFIYNMNGLQADGLTFDKFKWFLLLALFNGAYSTINDIQHRIAVTGTRTDMIITCFATLAILSKVYFITVSSKKIEQFTRMPRRTFTYAVLSSICGALAVNLLMAALIHVPSYLLYPIGSGALMIINTLLSRTALREKLKLNQYIGIAVAVVAIILTNI